MATLRLRNGVYFVDYRVDGVRRRVSTKTSDKKIAQAILKDYDAKIARAKHLGVPFDDLKKAETSKSDSSVPVFFRKFTERCRQRYAPGNLHSDVARLNAWRDYFARKSVRYLAQITPAHVNEFNTTVLASKKPKTLKNHLSLLKTALNYAVENGWIEENPIRKVKPPEVVSEPNWFTKGEIEKIIAEAEELLKTSAATQGFYSQG
jgi:integrase